MNIRKRTALRWTFLVGYIGFLSVLTGCAALAVGSSSLQQGLLQLDGDVVEVQGQNGDWRPVAGQSTFELVGNIESMDPWIVGSRTLQTSETTQIGEGLQLNEPVRVRGAILEDDVWLAYSIERLQEQTDPVITLIGVVTSVDPWVVNGITLQVTEETFIEGEIAPGMLVTVEILLLEDGTWEVIRIAPLGDVTETSGCTTVIATIVSVNGDQVQFLGWPTTVTLADGAQPGTDNDNEDGEESNNEQEEDVILRPGQKVLVVLCASDGGQVVIVRITVLEEDDETGGPSGNAEKVLVCHKPDKKGGHTISIASPAVPAHLGHGDKLGPCP